MNTRLQVEHPVTEAVTGLDLVEWQLRVAQGELLPLAQEDVRSSGHAIEVRLCAEDEHFSPHTGTILKFLPPQTSTRFDHAIFEGLTVPPYYDSMLGKLIVHAPTRAEAIGQLAGALDRTTILGLPTNRRMLAAILRHPVFQAGEATIPFLAQHADEIRGQLAHEERSVAAAAAAAFAPRSDALPCPFPRPLRIRHRGDAIEADASARANVQGVPAGGSRRHVQLGAVDLFLDDASFEPAARAGGAAAGTELRAPFNGKVIAVKAQPGAKVARGDTLLVIESMKLEHSLAAASDAVVKSIHVQPGQQASVSQVLVTFEAAA
jgi:3-methylcrotonyl-CoA carboxylase alpha subunit/geranyl-CoA carboxylase alpha subunit